MNSNFTKIDHIIVLMLENRSFDNMLGWLGSAEGETQQVNGVAGKNLSNPIPPFADNPDGRESVPVGQETCMTNPNPDPGEEYYHVNTQLFNIVNPPENRKKPFDRKPYNLPDNGIAPKHAAMDGFVHDYINNFTAIRKRPPTYDEYKNIMGCFTESSVPVISKLAKEYAVFDAWHSSVPSQTFPNRSFVHSATSNGFVTNSPYFNWLLTDAPTIFNRIQDKNDSELTWKVYFDKLDVVSLTGSLQPTIWKYSKTHFKYMEDFEADAANGTLPSYCFIEPRLFLDHNDQHPPIANPFVTTSVLAGELLINRVYQAVANGPKWENSLLIITYDEHGGCYDHVSPPSAVPPESGSPAGHLGFQFDRLGVRVPTVMISPYIKKGTIISDLHDHTSIIKTVCKRWGLEHLTNRDKHAKSFESVLNLPTARTDIPTLEPRPYEAPKNVRDEPINDLQKTLLYIIAGIDDAREITQDESALQKAEDLLQLVKDEGRIAHLKTVGDALDFLQDFADRRERPRSFTAVLRQLWEKIQNFLWGRK